MRSDEPMAVMDLDDTSTWPPEVHRLLDDSRELLRRWVDREAEIDAELERDPALRYEGPCPINQYRERRTRLIAELDQQLRDVPILGWHCTRLLENEIAAIERHGLEPLSVELVERRIRQAIEHHALTAAEADAIKRNSADASNRAGVTWVGFGRDPLRRHGNVWRLLTYWGGEALFWNHESGPNAALLERLGTACIVQLAVPTQRLMTFATAAERIVDATALGKPTTFEGRFLEPIAGRYVLRVLRRHDPEFEALTGATEWPGPPLT